MIAPTQPYRESKEPVVSKPYKPEKRSSEKDVSEGYQLAGIKQECHAYSFVVAAVLVSREASRLSAIQSSRV
jgi:hypothetical protein